MRAVYDRLLKVSRTFGPVTLKSQHDIPAARITKHERASAHRWHLELKLADPAEIDAELTGWLAEAYSLSA